MSWRKQVDTRVMSQYTIENTGIRTLEPRAQPVPHLSLAIIEQNITEALCPTHRPARALSTIKKYKTLWKAVPYVTFIDIRANYEIEALRC